MKLCNLEIKGDTLPFDSFEKKSDSKQVHFLDTATGFILMILEVVVES